MFCFYRNTASRIESSGERGKIHASAETAALLTAAGKDHWLKEREDTVHLKGKGSMKTYWLDMKQESNQSKLSLSVSPNELSKVQRLIDWNTDVLAHLLQQIEARRIGSVRVDKRAVALDLNKNGSVISEVKEIIQLPPFNTKHKQASETSHKVHLDPNVHEQLREYVSVIASLYRPNDFHNFEHAR